MSKTTKSKLEAIPNGWWLSGSHPADYMAGIDKTQAHSGTQCASSSVEQLRQTSQASPLLCKKSQPSTMLARE
ncbi:MAG: hypothetical protein Q8T09_21345 [Candidatus Melainabacteria bacterium]|nr:hypothetical protein [Candidatus Melainabacteria bacterium]